MTKLRFFANAVRLQLCRVNLILSCRPSDWAPVADLLSLSQALPVVKPPTTQPSSQNRLARESEVVDGKKPDIQILTVKGSKKAVIELKRADNWTILQLVKALEAQLVGQYLRHDDCATGFLLLTYHGDKSYWQHPESKIPMGFTDIVNFLNGHAKVIMQTSDRELFIKVHGIDLTAPYLAPAH